MNIKSILIALINMQFKTFLDVLGYQDERWSSEQFDQLRNNLSVYLCEVDDNTHEKLINWAIKKSGGEL